MKKIAGVVVEERDGDRRVRAWAPLPRTANQRRRRGAVQRKMVVALVALAVAVVGLVILLASQFAPTLSELLLQLLAAVL
jgi:type VI protein secretion system component VasF